MTSAPQPSNPGARRSSRWVLMPIILLASSTIGVGTMAAIAVHDPNFALEPDYYQKALHWDQTQAQAADNQRLAFVFASPSRVTLDARGQAQLEITVKSKDGQPVTRARLSAEAFPNAFSEDISQLTFSERAPGVYTASVKAHHPGLWELRLTMDAGVDHATAILRCDLVPGGAA